LKIASTSKFAFAGKTTTRRRLVNSAFRYLDMKNDSGPVHTNPFSNENGAVLLCFQKDLRPHLSFSYRFRPSTLQRRIRLKRFYTLIAHTQLNSTHAHFNISAREIGAILLAPGRVYLDDVTGFR